MHAWLADFVLFLHFTLAAFVILVLAAIWLGALLKWRWIRDFRLRLAHIVAITVVALEGVLGITCPLTVWEDWLRRSSGEASFIARWVQRLLFYDLPEWVFVSAYIAAAAATALAWIFVPPNRR